ncbi:MAG TPA: hypothetical protein VMT90_00685 [Dehalococcoidia bacterium]|jgi:hypothetical protein|nr:hypothetical protein [Dehalococcoidia bacterium]
MTSKQASHPWKIAVIGIGAVALCLFAAPPAATHAYTLNYYGTVDQNVCVAANGLASRGLFSGASPSDKTWVVQSYIGLNNGDDVQDAYFQFDLVNNEGKFRGAARNWIAVGLIRPYKGTITAHSGGTMTLQLVIDNHDSQQACYGVASVALWK